MASPGKILPPLSGLVFLCTALAAGAQPMRVPGTETNGFKIGEGRLHTFLETDFGFDSAAFVAANCAGAPATVGSALATCSELEAHIRPGFDLKVPASWIDFDFNAQLDYLWYTGLLHSIDTQYSRAQGAANLSAAMNRDGPVEVDVTDGFSRSDVAHDPSIGIGVLSLYNQAGLAVPIHPGGRALEITPRFAYNLERFTPITAVPGTNVTISNYDELQAGVDGRWRFLPKTAVVVDSTFSSRTYPNGGTPIAGATSPTADVLLAEGGLSGLVTAKVAVVAEAGWGVDFGNSNGSTFIGRLEGTYLMSELATFKLGVVRTLEPVSQYGTVTDTRPYVQGRMLLGGRLSLRALIGFDWLDYSTLKGAAGMTPRTDLLWGVDAGLDYQFFPWLIGSAGYLLGSRHSNVAGTSPTTGLVVDYSRNEAYVGVTLTY